MNPTTEPFPDESPLRAARDFYRDPRLKSPIVATVLSLMPGLGQVYLGYTRLGFIHGFTLAALIALLSSNHLGGLEPLFGVSLAFFYLYNLVDAHRRAVLLNEAVLRLEVPELPDGFGAVSTGARILMGLALIVVGMGALLSLEFGISFAWLERWWPAGLVAAGLILVWQALRERVKAA